MSHFEQLSRIVVLDFGSQYAQLICRRIREVGVFAEIYPYDADPDLLNLQHMDGLVLSGGPSSVATETVAMPVPDWVWGVTCPVLGICYGMQAMTQHWGGRVAQAQCREFGHATLQVEAETWCGKVWPNEMPTVWMSHGDHVAAPGDDLVVCARSSDGVIAAIQHVSKPYYGVQFHPEVTHTEGGAALLAHFAMAICGCRPTWQQDEIVAQLVDDIRAQVGQDHVILGASGGVDSTVVAALLHRAIGERLHCVFVDNGLLRAGEVAAVQKMFAKDLGIPLQTVDAKQIFYDALAGQTDPEQKRKTIGRVFVDVFQAQAESLTQVKWLAQGTIYPDVIESAGAASGKAEVIKSHHNVGGLPAHLALGLVEPLRHLFKDEVRAMGLHLGIPAHMIQRHPFPGPGLGVRILGDVTAEAVDILQRVDALYLEMLQQAGWMDQVSQAFAVFLPIRSVGVVGDQRTHGFVVALRAVTTTDFMTARAAALPNELLSKMARHILNAVPEVARVVYDISDKPPATIEWE